MLTYSDMAHAHRPYLNKEGYISYQNQHNIIKERLYGDGIFFKDPSVFQLRNEHGAVLARSPVDEHTAVFCPSLELCYIFPYHSLNLFTDGWKLDKDAVIKKLNQSNAYQFQDSKEETSFKEYINNEDVTSARSVAFGYPEMGDQKSIAFTRIPLWLTILISPLFIVLNSGTLLTGLLLLTFLIFPIYWLIFEWKNPSTAASKAFIFLIGMGILFSYISFYVFYIFVAVFTFSLTKPYALITIITGVILGQKFLLKRETIKNKK